MKASEAALLLPQMVVMWDGDPNDRGVVVENYPGSAGHPGMVYIEWKDGLHGWHFHVEMERISIAPKEET